MRPVAATLLLFVVACGPVPEEPEPVPTFDEAVADIRARLRDAAGFDFTTHATVYEVTDLDEDTLGQTIAGGGKANILIRPVGPGDVYSERNADGALSPWAFRLVLVHEFGHAIGLTHVDDPYSVMYPNLTYRVELEDAIAEVAAQAVRR
jgi:hypothetical protein